MQSHLASFRSITLISFIVQILGWLQQIFQMSEFLGFLRYFRMTCKFLISILLFQRMKLSALCTISTYFFSPIAQQLMTCMRHLSQGPALYLLLCFYVPGKPNEPPHDKTNKMACAPSEDSDQPGHSPSLIRVFAVRMKKAWVLSYPLSAQRRLWSDWADAQADLSLRWVHSHFVGFVMRRLRLYGATATIFIIFCHIPFFSIASYCF